MDSNPEQSLAITKSIIDLRDPSRSCELVERKSRKIARFDDSAIVFYDNERYDLLSSHNGPLYVTASINGVELKRAMVDPGCSSNIISLSVLDAVSIPRERITKQPTKCRVSEVTILTPLGSSTLT